LNPRRRDKLVVDNRFTIHVATVNGSKPDQPTLLPLFQMGIPVSGRTSSRPTSPGSTWFTIRANDRGPSRHKRYDLLVALNPETSVADIAAMQPGSILVVADGLPMPAVPPDRTLYKVPFTKLVEPLVADAKLRKLVVNMIYVGVVSWLLGIDPAEVDRALVAQLGKKPKALEMNRAAVASGIRYAEEHMKRTPFQARRMDRTAGKILIDGNQAGARRDVRRRDLPLVVPDHTVVEPRGAARRASSRDIAAIPDKATYAVIQAEDDRRDRNGARRVLGRRSGHDHDLGPGLSLMTEFTGYAYYAEIPAVIWDIQRIGPSTDCRPDLAGRSPLGRVPLARGYEARDPLSRHRAGLLRVRPAGVRPRRAAPDAGVRPVRSRHRDEHVVVEPFRYPDEPWDRGKVLNASDLERLKKFERYRDVDGDAIPYRTPQERITHWPPTSRAARDTTRRRGTRRVRKPIHAS
jgi:2-oxoglutarate ferredoxin oxidoreductase subunit alpha